MDPNDDEIRDYVKLKTSRLMSLAVYEKIKAAILAYQREEHAKSKVLAGALWGLFPLSIFSALAIFFVRPYAGYLFLGGFFTWFAYVVVLMNRHLGTLDEKEHES